MAVGKEKSIDHIGGVVDVVITVIGDGPVMVLDEVDVVFKIASNDVDGDDDGEVEGVA